MMDRIIYKSKPEPEPVNEAVKRFNKRYVKKNYMSGKFIKINREDFTAYMEKRKPYIKHDLKITELAAHLNTNRTYLSRFINIAFSMNFNSYINLCRLREMERLLNLPDKEERSVAQLAMQAGFATVRNYTRAKRRFAPGKRNAHTRRRNIRDTTSLHAVKNEDIKRLEAYMCNEKPYLNSRLRITDIIRKLNTNRTSLSLLINRTYGMNFSRFINRYRLAEMEELNNDPANAGVSQSELAVWAGFSDRRGYVRAKQREAAFKSSLPRQ
jgi:AraC-like DNA-binding protein